VEAEIVAEETLAAVPGAAGMAEVEEMAAVVVTDFPLPKPT
jgi:hypothetical protein